MKTDAPTYLPSREVLTELGFWHFRGDDFLCAGPPALMLSWAPFSAMVLWPTPRPRKLVRLTATSDAELRTELRRLLANTAA